MMTFEIISNSKSVKSSDQAGAIQFWRARHGATVALFRKPNHVHDIAFSSQTGIVA
jgi:hypothetical protein